MTNPARGAAFDNRIPSTLPSAIERLHRKRLAAAGQGVAAKMGGGVQMAVGRQFHPSSIAGDHTLVSRLVGAAMRRIPTPKL